MSDKTIVAVCTGIAGTIYVVAVTAAYHKGKVNGRRETSTAFRQMAKDILKEHMANRKAV